MRFFQALFNRTLNSVYFGICTMVLVGVYIAIGSGCAGVREYFEMNELQFFNAWPLKLLMWMLVLNLATVTVTRIPFTKPRYGVWMVHTGIVTLIFGMGYYYKMKVEGLAIVMKGSTATHFYDSGERSLFFKVGGVPAGSVRLPSLPRFAPYAEELGNADRLNKSDLRGIVPTIEMEAGKAKTIAAEFGLPSELKLDVVGYYPWATVKSTISEDASADQTGAKPQAGSDAIKLTMTDPHSGASEVQWLMAGDPRTAVTVLADMEFEHRRVDGETMKMLPQAASEIHRLDIKVPGYEGVLMVEPGRNYDLGKSGYSITVEDFNPDFPAMNGERISLITLMVKSPTQTFRRQVIMGREKPTDWKLNVEGAGPMGKRQNEPLDKDLTIAYTYSDPLRLTSREGMEKRLFLTDEKGDLTVVTSSPKAGVKIEEMKDGKGSVQIGPVGHPIAMSVQRVAHAKKTDSVTIVPPSQRERNVGEAGLYQVLMVKVSCGSWSQVVAVPYAQWAEEASNSWEGGSVAIPVDAVNSATGAKPQAAHEIAGDLSFQMQLGQTRLPLPAKVSLEKFELENYPGGTPETTSVFKDFKSTIAISPWPGHENDGPVTTDMAHMNHPVYWGGIGNSYWTFFQAQWDPNGQRYTVLGVGNRPGTWIMTAGCVLIISGLWWAFYLKPVIIRNMKRKALEKAAAKKKQLQEV